MTEPLDSFEERELLAAEYALGLLDAFEAARAARLEAEDVEFARLVTAWRDRAAGWVADLSAEPVPDAALRRIDSAIGTIQENSRATSRWKTLAVVSMAASVVLAVALASALLTRGDTVAPAPAEHEIAQAPRNVNVAQIQDGEGSAIVSALYDPSSGKIAVRTTGIGTEQKAPELWVLDDAGTPHSLGQFDTDGVLTVRLSPEVRRLLVDEAVIAITLENRDGAPHREPTGEILGTASLVTL